MLYQSTSLHLVTAHWNDSATTWLSRKLYSICFLQLTQFASFTSLTIDFASCVQFKLNAFLYIAFFISTACFNSLLHQLTAFLTLVLNTTFIHCYFSDDFFELLSQTFNSILSFVPSCNCVLALAEKISLCSFLLVGSLTTSAQLLLSPWLLRFSLTFNKTK